MTNQEKLLMNTKTMVELIDEVTKLRIELEESQQEQFAWHAAANAARAEVDRLKGGDK